MKYSNDMQDVYKNIEEYNPGKKTQSTNIFLKYRKKLDSMLHTFLL